MWQRSIERTAADKLYDELFAKFHCLVTGNANKLYWQLLEDHEAANSHYALIKEIMERKKRPTECFKN